MTPRKALGALADQWPTLTAEVKAQLLPRLTDAQRAALAELYPDTVPWQGIAPRADRGDLRIIAEMQAGMKRLAAEIQELHRLNPPRLLPPVKPDLRADILTVLRGGDTAPWVLGNLAHSEGYRDYYTGPDAYDQCRADCMRELYTLRADGLILWDGDSGDRVILVKDVQNV